MVMKSQFQGLLQRLNMTDFFLCLDEMVILKRHLSDFNHKTKCNQ